jgi:ADP-ribosyl-[dinitrogen reductase] hydrolase
LKVNKDAIYGFIIGDCLGVPYEFSQSNNIKKLEMTTGTHNQLPGTWSDDTACLLATLDTDITNIVSVCENLQEVVGGKYFPDGVRYDIGFSTYKALTGQDRSNVLQDGNGALMRILPYAFLDNYSCLKNTHLVTKIAELTHYSSLSNGCCLDYLRLINNALNNNFNIYGYFDYQSKDGYVVDSLKIVLKVCKEATSYQDGMTRCINIGGDTDTHCALVGAYLALKYKDWRKYVKQIRNVQLVEGVLKKY